MLNGQSNNKEGSMARKVFYSFHFKNDFWRTQQVRNINALEGQTLATANDWEQVKQRGDNAVKEWIAKQMEGKSCVVVLVGESTSSRRWVKHEIAKAWNDGKGVLGIHINKLKDNSGNSSPKGANPFEKVVPTSLGRNLGGIVPIKTPSGTTSQATYASIKDNIVDWIEDAIAARRKYK